MVRVLTKLGYPAHSIRKAIVVLNDMTLADIANGETYIQNISNTLNGKRQSERAKALMDDGPCTRGPSAGRMGQGNRYFLALTSELVKAFVELGKEKGLPNFPFRDIQFGLRLMKNRHELKKLGWVRSEQPGKIIQGYKYYKYKLLNPEGGN